MTSSTFGAYKNEGRLVDRKGYNLHIGGLVEPTLAYLTTAGTTAFLYTAGDIPAGAICGESLSINGSGAAGYINVCKGASGEIILGVSVDERGYGDPRPITLTWLGYVRLIADDSGITKGDFLRPTTTSGYYGAAMKWESNSNAGSSTNAETNAAVLVRDKLKFGKAITSASAGEYFDAFINCAGV